MRRAARVDRNQPEIVRALRDIGATVQHIHMIGGGCPDILVGYRGTSYVFEIKDSAKPPSKRRLTPMEAKWHDNWRGQVAIVTSIDEAIKAVSDDS